MEGKSTMPGNGWRLLPTAAQERGRVSLDRLALGKMKRGQIHK